VTLARSSNMTRLILLLSLPMLLVAETVSYGEDPFLLGLSLDAYALGQVRALPMSSISLGANGARLTVEDATLGYQHTEGFGGIYQTDVLQICWSQWNLNAFRGGVSGIADTREALLDYGSDGQPNTQDADGTENNGQLDPGERLSVHDIDFFGTQQWVAELGYNRQLSSRFAIHGTARLLYHNLHSQSGFGVGFHAGMLFQPLEHLRLGLQITDLLTTTVFWSEGSTEQYPPQVFLAADYEWLPRRVPFSLRPVIQLHLTPFHQEYSHGKAGVSYGLELGFKDQLMALLGMDAEGQPMLGATLRTPYLDLQYATAFGTLRETTGATHRLGATFRLNQIPFFN